MDKIQYLDEIIEVPTGWHEVKLRAYEKHYTEKPQTLREKIILIAKICEIDENMLLAWPSDAFNIIATRTAFIFSPHTVDPCPSIKIAGVTYVIPIEEKLSLGAYIDADEVLKGGDRKLSQLLAITCRPAGEAYDTDTVDARAEMFAGLSMAEVQPLLSFFLHCRDASEARTTAFTNLAQAVDLLPRNIKPFRKPGGGISLSQMWQAIKYYCLIILLRYRLRKCSRLYNSNAIKTSRKRHSARLTAN